MPYENLHALADKLVQIDRPAIKNSFVEMNEFIHIRDFLPTELTNALIKELDKVDGAVHRSFIPRHKKGGSVCRYDLDRLAPIFTQLYELEPLRDFLSYLPARPLIRCPIEDPHGYALYYYTEPGDHIGYHYDTSYYKGARYTVLLGLVDDSSCKLGCQLFKDDESKEAELIELQLEPGMLVFFNGDKLYHRITPLKDNERRVALTLEYLTTTHMNFLLRFISNMKDSVAYFGFKQVFGANKR